MENMTDLLDGNLHTFLDRLAERTPTPGGGGATALCGAVACAQARMVVAYSTTKKTDPGAHEALEHAAGRLERCDRMLRRLIAEDAAGYENLAAVGKAARQDEGRTGEYQVALAAAIAVPLEMAAVASTALKIMDEVKTMANPRLLSDLGVAAVVAESTARAARYSVRVNVREISDAKQRSEYHAQIDSIVDHCINHRASVESYVLNRL